MDVGQIYGRMDGWAPCHRSVGRVLIGSKTSDLKNYLSTKNRGICEVAIKNILQKGTTQIWNGKQC